MTRYRLASESAERTEDELKVEKRKLQREVRCWTAAAASAPCWTSSGVSSGSPVAPSGSGPGGGVGGLQRTSDQAAGEDEGQPQRPAGAALTPAGGAVTAGTGGVLVLVQVQVQVRSSGHGCRLSPGPPLSWNAAGTISHHECSLCSFVRPELRETMKHHKTFFPIKYFDKSGPAVGWKSSFWLELELMLEGSGFSPSNIIRGV